MGVELLILVLIVFMLLACLIAVETKDLLSAVICVGAAGFALSVINLLVRAPDLAITQVVVEVVALVLLVRVVLTRRDTSEAETSSRDVLRTGAALLAGGVILVAAFFAVGGHHRGPEQAPGTMPPFAAPVLTHPAADPDRIPPGVGREYLVNAKDKTGASNAVTAVLLDFRAYDTLGEATIIFAAVLGVYAILRTTRRKEESEP